MKIAEACRASGCIEKMYCFDGRDKKNKNTLCLACICKLAEDYGYKVVDKQGKEIEEMLKHLDEKWKRL